MFIPLKFFLSVSFDISFFTFKTVSLSKFGGSYLYQSICKYVFEIVEVMKGHCMIDCVGFVVFLIEFF